VGWKVFVFSGNPALARQIGLEPVEQVPLFNGKIPCRLLRQPRDVLLWSAASIAALQVENGQCAAWACCWPLGDDPLAGCRHGVLSSPESWPRMLARIGP
jgi:hypothetical protein